MDDRFTSEAGRFEWVKPDLSRGSSWHLARVYNIVDACKGLRDRKQHFLKGPADLAKPSVQLRARRYRIALTLVLHVRPFRVTCMFRRSVGISFS